MDVAGLDPPTQSVAGSTTNQMEGVEGEEQSTPINLDNNEQPTTQTQNPSGDANVRDKRVEEEVVLKQKRQKTSKMWEEYDPHFRHMPIDEEWEHVESVCEVLKVCTNIISGSDYPTADLYLI
ncbi:hypothetical protein L1887_04847 [Cichorium endivia]|nr:hypothetical protein L1887_04847 [Cichorium endivia]